MPATPQQRQTPSRHLAPTPPTSAQPRKTTRHGNSSARPTHCGPQPRTSCRSTAAPDRLPCRPQPSARRRLSSYPPVLRPQQRTQRRNQRLPKPQRAPAVLPPPVRTDGTAHIADRSTTAARLPLRHSVHNAGMPVVPQDRNTTLPHLPWRPPPPLELLGRLCMCPEQTLMIAPHCYPTLLARLPEPWPVKPYTAPYQWYNYPAPCQTHGHVRPSPTHLNLCESTPSS